MHRPTLLDPVRLTRDIPERGLASGALGSVVEVYDDGYEVEFVALDGSTVALVTLDPEDLMVADKEGAPSDQL